MTEKKYYVYTLRHGGRPFYVGKGCGDRVHHHRRNANAGIRSPLYDYIRGVWQAGGTVQWHIEIETESEQAAFDYEARLIRLLGLEYLFNRIHGNEQLVSVPSLDAEGEKTWIKKPFADLSREEHLLLHELAQKKADRYRRQADLHLSVALGMEASLEKQAA